MKQLSLLFFLAVGAAAVSSDTSSRHANGPRVLYRLRAIAPTASPIDGHYLSVGANNNSVGVYGRVAPDAAPRFYTTSVQGSTTETALHDPTTSIDHVLALVGALVGQGGLLALRDVMNPNTRSAPGGGGGGDDDDRVDWESFTLDASSSILSYAGAEGS